MDGEFPEHDRTQATRGMLVCMTNSVQWGSCSLEATGSRKKSTLLPFRVKASRESRIFSSLITLL